MKNKEFGITYNCPICGETIRFPRTPNADTDRHEALAHALYSCSANNKKPCWRCELENEQKKRRNRKKKYG